MLNIPNTGPMQQKYPAQIFTCCLGILLSFCLSRPATAYKPNEPQITVSSAYKAARARVSLVPKGVMFRSSLNGISIWQAGCVYSSISPDSAANALNVIRAHQLHNRPDDERFEIRNAIEITTLQNDNIVILFSEVLHEPGRPDFVRGQYLDKRRFLTQKFETDSSFADAVRSWAFYPPAPTLAPASPDTCDSMPKSEEVLLPPYMF